uniref:Uncharacterized protein n=1 Tax=Anguilla anguilla TaxID=7936 RepID=A0A0E9S459_ANGAN
MSRKTRPNTGTVTSHCQNKGILQTHF